MGKILILISILLLLLSNSASASTEEAFYQSNSVRSSGWELDYGEDEELDKDERAKEKKRAEKKRNKRKSKKKEDFFKTSIDVYDKDLGSLHGRE